MTGQIFINDNERLQVDTLELTCGSALQVLVVDGRTDTPQWINTTVEHNGQEYYLTGLFGYSIPGLFARIE